MARFTFEAQMRMSEGQARGVDATKILLAEIPGATAVRRASNSDDRAGTDYWVRLCNGSELSVDLKARKSDFAVKSPPQDDLALELWSVREPPKIGWTLDVGKRTEYVLWHWQDTGRWCLLPFRLLLAAFLAHKDEWAAKYKHDIQTSRNGRGEWQSECLFVPRREVWAAIYRLFSGNVTQVPAPSVTATTGVPSRSRWVEVTDYDDSPTDEDLRREAALKAVR